MEDWSLVLKIILYIYIFLFLTFIQCSSFKTLFPHLDTESPKPSSSVCEPWSLRNTFFGIWCHHYLWSCLFEAIMVASPLMGTSLNLLFVFWLTGRLLKWFEREKNTLFPLQTQASRSLLVYYLAYLLITYTKILTFSRLFCHF